MDRSAVVHKSANIASHVVIGANVHISEGVTIEPFSFIGGPEGTHTFIGKNSIIRSHSRVYGGVQIGQNFQGGNQITIRSGTEIGDNCSVGTGSDIQGDCSIGSFTRMHSNVHICQGAEIGRFCWFFPGVILTNDSRPPSQEQRGPKIEDEVVLTVQVCVMPGVTVRKGTVVLPSATVSKNTEQDSLVFGPRSSYSEETSKLLMPLTGSAAYPWIFRYGDGRYPEAALKEQRDKRNTG